MSDQDMIDSDKYNDLCETIGNLSQSLDELKKELAQVKAENEELKRFIISWGEEIRSDIEVDNHKQLYLDCIDFETCCRKILKKEQEK